MSTSSISLLEPSDFTLHHNPASEIEYPIDKSGDATLTYAGKQYRFRKEYIKYSQLLQALYDNDGHLENFKLKHEYSPESFRLVMKLLFGFKNVIIPDQRLMQTYAIIEEMRIDNDEGFHPQLEKYVLTKLEKSAAFVKEAYDISLRIENDKIKSKCLELINVGPAYKKGPEVEVVKSSIIPKAPGSASKDILKENLVEKVDELLEMPKAGNFLKLMVSMLSVYLLLAISFSYLETYPRNIKILKNGSYQKYHLTCDEGYVEHGDFCIPKQNQTLAKKLITYAEEVNRVMAIQNGHIRCETSKQNHVTLTWNDVKKQVIDFEGTNSTKYVLSMLENQKPQFDYYFENLRHTAIIDNNYVTSDEVLEPLCSAKIAISYHWFLSAFIIALVCLQIFLITKLLNPMMNKRNKGKMTTMVE